MPNRLAEKARVITGTGGSIGDVAMLAFAREGAPVVGFGHRIGYFSKRLLYVDWIEKGALF